MHKFLLKDYVVHPVRTEAIHKVAVTAFDVILLSIQK